MKLAKNHNGFSAVEALLVFIILCMVGFMGWFVWQSQQAADKTYSHTDTSDSQSAKPKKAAIKTETALAPASVNVSFTYPATWNVVKLANYDTQIVGPDNDVYIEVKGLGGLGGSCNPNDPGSGTFRSVQSEALNNAAFSLMTFTTQTDTYTGGVSSQIIPTADVAKYKVGASVCAGYLDGVLDKTDLGKQSAQDTSIGNTTITITSQTLASAMKSGSPTDVQVQAFLSSDDFKQAEQIVKSFSYN